jgi:hypothetical protein
MWVFSGGEILGDKDNSVFGLCDSFCGFIGFEEQSIIFIETLFILPLSSSS